ncbi:MAG: aminopeptidase [Burkholderiaceae bacterium]|nr:aminopeptidase [Burkholderiaceae bacterium]
MLRSLAAALALPALLCGCSSWGDGPGYYWQSMAGHLAVIRETRPIDEWLAGSSLDPELRRKLEEVQAIRRFASAQLALPENGSYTGYADLKRPYVVWNVFATPELSLKLKEWCFPVAGCVGYRGYYDARDAEDFAARLRAGGHEAFVRGVPAYSTLGWFDDPVLNTFVRYPDGELARLVFHELAHQALYLKGDTTFNESFATTVEQIGLERWLAVREAAGADPVLRVQWQRFAARREQFLALLARHRIALEAVYASDRTDHEKRALKARVFAALRSDYEGLKRQWGGYAGYDRWFAQPLTNAHLASVATYTAQVPAFRALLAHESSDLPRFYAAARRLAELPKAERERALAALGLSATEPPRAGAPAVEPPRARPSPAGLHGAGLPAGRLIALSPGTSD